MRDLNAFCLNMTPPANCVPYCSTDPRSVVILWSSVLVCIFHCMIICSAKINLILFLSYSIHIPWHHWQKIVGSPKQTNKTKK